MMVGAWLVRGADGALRVVTTANQDSPLMGASIAGAAGTPILGLDVWEVSKTLCSLLPISARILPAMLPLYSRRFVSSVLD